MNTLESRLVYEFGDFRLDATQRLLLSKGDGRVLPLTSRAFETLLYLVEHRGELLDKATLMKAIWPNTVVEENNLNQNITALRRVLGEKPEEHRFIVTVPGRGYQFVANVGLESGISGAGRQPVAPSAEQKPHAKASHPRQSVQFCTTPDGVRLAYAIVGKGRPLVKTGHWLSHLEYDWESPVYRHMVGFLSQNYQLIRYDHRGNGLSDWDVAEISLQAFVTDLETVVDAACVERFALLGMSAGSPASIAYAVKHPERVSHLVLRGAYAKGMISDAEAEARAMLVKNNWGRDNPAFRQMFTTSAMPDATLEEQNWFNEQQRLTTSPDNAARILMAIHRANVTELLGQVKVPTLVLHVRDDGAVPLEAGRNLAASIPGARFVLLEGRNHMLLEHDSASARFKEELVSFLGDG